MRAKALVVLFAIALALYVSLTISVASQNTDATLEYPLAAGKDTISEIILEKAGFMGAGEDDRGNIWLADSDGNLLYRSGWKSTPVKTPGIRQLLAIDEYYRESGAVRERLTLDDILACTLESGGFTYNPLYGATPGRGYAVSLQGHGKVLDSGNTTGDGLLTYLRANGEQTEDPAQYVGGWVDDGRLYLDISIVLPDEKEARRAGWINDQTSVFNLGTNETIYLKGPGGNWLIDAGGDWLPGAGRERDLSAIEGPSQAVSSIMPLAAAS